ncbi:MAG: Clp protease N-terminal domain-containing protein [Hyphomicrobiaceae bacterium]
MLEAVAEDFGKIPLSQMLAATVARGMDYARAQNHRTMTLEHLLLALTEDEEAALVLIGCNVDLIRLRDDVAGFLGQVNDRAPPDAASKPVIAPELKRIIEYAAAAAQQAKRSNVNGAITLAAMIGEGRSMAASFLRAQGLTFEVAVRVLQQQGKPQMAPGGNQASTEDILSGARARIAASRGQGGPRPQVAPSPTSRGMVQRPEPRLPEGDSAAVQPWADRPLPDAVPRPDGPSQQTARDGTTLPASDRLGEDLADAAEEIVVEEARGTGRAPPPLPHTRADTGALGPRPADDENNPTRPPLPQWMQTGGKGVPRERPQKPGGPSFGASDPNLEQPALRSGRPVGGGPAGSIQGEGARQPSGSQMAPLEPPRVHRRPSIEPGQLVENIPRRMRVGTTESVEVRIARDGVPGVSSGLQGQAPPVRHDLVITKAMSVRLRAPEGGFNIEAGSPETQWTEATPTPLSSDFASWRFRVTPDRRGDATLQLIVAARVVGRDGIVAETALPDRVISVRVRTNYVRTGLRGAAWLAALAIGGVIGKLGENAFTTVAQLVRRGLSP